MCDYVSDSDCLTYGFSWSTSMKKLRGDVTVNDLLSVHTRDGNLVSTLTCTFMYTRSERET